MNRAAHFVARTRVPFLAAVVLVTGSTWCCADDADPTIPSPSITERLLEERGSASTVQPVPAAKNAPPLQLRLKGIVLRDKDNGMALVSLPDGESYVIPLQRWSLSSMSNVLNINGMNLVVKDFSEASIIMRNPVTSQEIIIN